MTLREIRYHQVDFGDIGDFATDKAEGRLTKHLEYLLSIPLNH